MFKNWKPCLKTSKSLLPEAKLEKVENMEQDHFFFSSENEDIHFLEKK